MSRSKGAGEREGASEVVLGKIAAMPAPYDAMGVRLHELIMRSAPQLRPTTWYGMPAYARNGAIVCFFRADRYMTLGLTDKADLSIEPDAPHQLRASSWFFDTMDGPTEAEIAAIVSKAAR